MHAFTTTLEQELRALRARLCDSIAVEHEYRDDLGAFGHHSDDAELERLRERRHQESFLLERPSDALGAVPLDRFFDGLDEAQGEELASVYACLRASHVGVFTVKMVDERDGVLLEDLLGRGQYALIDPELALVLLVGDMLVGRIYPLSIETDGARTGWAASPAALHVRNRQLLDALERDIEVMRERARGPLRMTQRDLEAMFFSPDIALSEDRAARPPADPRDLRKKARGLLVDAGLPDARVDAYLDALSEHPMPASDLVIGGDDPLGWILEELAFESDVELDQARRVIAAYWRSLSVAQAEPEEDAKVGEERAREALAKFDAGRAAGKDLEDLFAELEADLGLEVSEDEDGPLEFTGEFPGAMGALVQEFLWDAARMAQTPLETFAKQHRDLELFAQFGSFIVNADELEQKHVELFLGRWIWESGRLERGGYSALGAVHATRAFCVWMSEHQDVDLAGEVEPFLALIERDATRIADLGRTADPSGATVGAKRGYFEYVGRKGEEVRWLEQSGGTFAGRLAGDTLAKLESGDWVEAWHDAEQLGVIHVYPPVAGPYLKATS